MKYPPLGLAVVLCLVIGLLGCQRTQPRESESSGDAVPPDHPTPFYASGPTDSATVPIRVMTYNIRFNNPADTAWIDRRGQVASMIRFHQPTVLGTQEGQLHQLMDLEDRLPSYEWIGVGRKSGGDEFSAILYRTGRLEILGHDTFWLSPTPEEPGSKGWDAALPRIVTWARFRDRVTGAVFVMFNAHFDHKGKTARTESARLIVERANEIAESLPAVVVGDFNAEPGNRPIQIMTRTDTALRLQDAMEISEAQHHGPMSTFNDFTPNVLPGRRIDYVFVSPSVDVLRHGHLSDRWGASFPSDHLPVMADLVF